jgi:hypothetical protein
VSQESRRIRLIMDLRNSGVTNTSVLSAMERIPRERFVEDSFLDQAWANRALPISCGQTISQPLVVGLMTQALELNDRHTVLEIGTGSGYQAAILSRLCRRVYTIERHKDLLQTAELRLKRVTAGKAGRGWLRLTAFLSQQQPRSYRKTWWPNFPTKAASWFYRSERLANRTKWLFGSQNQALIFSQSRCSPCVLFRWFRGCPRVNRCARR